VKEALKIQENFEVKIGSTVLKTIAYFDIFEYPLQTSEIKKFCGQKLTEEQFNIAMNALLSQGCIFRLDEFYSLRNNFSLAENRRKGNERATKLFPKALEIGAFLYKFPFVRGVAISGSLSKNFADEKGDIDFFILTKANRLWVARTFMHLFKKLTYVFGKQHSYCMNYYLDETCLEIAEKNVYTATEIKTLVPVAGSSSLELFFEKNEWSDGWLPGFQNTEQKIVDRISIFKRFFEWLLNNKMGEGIDNYLFKLTTKRWLRKESRGKKNIKGRIMNLLTSKHFAKSNPDFYQERIIEKYNNRIDEIKSRWPEFFQ
jgi:hypothetical protein